MDWKLKLNNYLDTYIDRWDEINPKEEYKWIAFKQFNNVWYSSNLKLDQKIHSAFSKSKNLLMGRRYFPVSMLENFAEAHPKETERLLENLFDEHTDIKDRAYGFIAGCKSLLSQMKEEGYSDWKGRDNVQSYQDVHAISLYLAMRNPKQYFIYKALMFHTFAQKVGYKITGKRGIGQFIEYESLCPPIREEIEKRKAFVKYYRQWLKEHDYKDDNLTLLTQDLIYAIHYHIKVDFKPEAKKKDMAVEAPQIYDTSNVETISLANHHSFLPKKGEDFVEIGKLKNDIGLRGELWVKNHELFRLHKQGLNGFTVHHSSIDEGDGIGYDLCIKDSNDEVERYIEVKTTKGECGQPFFFSDNELAFSKEHPDKYYLYRVYNFVSENKPAKLLILHGSLERLNGAPTEYKVIVKGK